jgi:UMF1 family MFS transporter
MLGYSKIYMFLFAGLTSVSVMLWLALEDPRWYYAANILNIVGNVCYGAAFVFYTSYIPKLARNHPEVLNAATPEEKIERLSFRTSRISIFGSATGFLGGFIQMLIAVGICWSYCALVC